MVKIKDLRTKYVAFDDLQLKVVKYAMIDKLSKMKEKLEYWKNYKIIDNEITPEEKELMIKTTREEVDLCENILLKLDNAMYMSKGVQYA